MKKEDMDPATVAATAIEDKENEINSSLYQKIVFEEEFEEWEDEVEKLFAELYKKVKGLEFRNHTGTQKKADVFSDKNIANITKATLAGWLEKSLEAVYYSRSLMRTVNGCLGKLKNEKIEDKETIIKLQEEVMKKQGNDLSAVHDTVKKEMKSYSEIVAKKCGTVPAITTKQLKSAVREAVTQEDRSKNVMVFGLEEEEGEDLGEKIAGLMEDMGEKPQLVDCRRLGEGTKKPVKVTLRSSEAARQILTNSKKLRQTPRRKSVYVCPDRTPEEREIYAKLNLEMKQKMKDDPGQYFFIRNRKICQVNRRPPDER